MRLRAIDARQNRLLYQGQRTSHHLLTADFTGAKAKATASYTALQCCGQLPQEAHSSRHGCREASMQARVLM